MRGGGERGGKGKGGREISRLNTGTFPCVIFCSLLVKSRGWQTFYKEQHSKYFRFSVPYSVLGPLNCAITM